MTLINGHDYKILVQLAGSGKADYQFTKDNVVISKSDGGWDDTTPYPTGIYYGLIADYRKRSAFFFKNQPPGRNEVFLHADFRKPGSPTTGSMFSKGCLTVDQVFINTIYTTLKTDKVFDLVNSPDGVMNSGGIEIDIKNELTTHLVLKASKPGSDQSLPSNEIPIIKGEKVDFSLKFDGVGAPGGLSKDIMVCLRTEPVNIGDAQGATPGKDFVPLPDTLKKTPLTAKEEKGGALWVTIPANTEEVTFPLHTILEGTEETPTALKVYIQDYAILYHDGTTYKDGDGDSSHVLLAGQKKDQLVDSQITAVAVTISPDKTTT